MFDTYNHITSADAKKEYFLDTKDLAQLPYESEYNGFGRGPPTKWYKMDLLELKATNKHGAAGLAKKRDQRRRRQEKQHQKELKAAEAQQALLNPMQQASTSTSTTPVANQAPNDENAPPSQNTQATQPDTVKKTSAKELAALRKDIVKAFKPLITWDYMRTKRSPNGCNVTAHISRVPPADYATLIGRPTDTELKTVVKRGAWYSTDVPFSTVMDSNDGIIGKGGRYGCNSELGLDPSCSLTVKFKPSDNTLSVTGYVRHVDTFEEE